MTYLTWGNSSCLHHYDAVHTEINMLLTPQSKKIDHNTKINEFEKKITDDDHDQYITSPKCFPARLKEANDSKKEKLKQYQQKN